MDLLREKLVPINSEPPVPPPPPPPPATTNDFNYIRSFNYMTERRLLRKLKGTYQKYSSVMSALSTVVWVYVLFVLIVTSVVGAEKTELSVNSVAVIACVFYVALYVAQRLAGRLLLIMIYCMVFAHATFYAVADDFGLFAIVSDKDNAEKTAKLEKHKTSRTVVLVVLFVVEFAIVAGYVTMYKLYPVAIRRGWLDSEWWFGIQRGKRSNTLTYMSLVRRWNSKRSRVEYIGGLDQENRPHGFGLWKDSAYHGENLSGLWEHGIPIGPFTSREQGSGFTTEKLRIAYASIRGEKTTDAADVFPSFKPLTWGVANVECSVAGGFFSFLPSVEHFFDDSSPHANGGELLHYRRRPQNAEECIATLRTPLDYVAYHDVDGQQHEDAPSHQRTKHKHFKESFAPVAVPNQHAFSEENKEALVYIHGIYTPLDSALSSIAQIMALGDFPSHIHPFVFAWPSGSMPLYFFQSLQAAGDTKSATGLRDFFASIVAAGYSKVNIVTHSMGTRCLFNCFEGGYLRDLFQTTADSTNGTLKSAEIVSFTFCSPEYPLPKFVAAGGMFDIIRQYCSLITLYGDSQDQALWGSEFALSDNLLHGTVPSLGRSIGKHVRDPSFPVPCECVYMSSGRFDSSADDAKDLSYAKVNQMARLPSVVGFALFGSTVSSANGSSAQSQPALPSLSPLQPEPLEEPESAAQLLPLSNGHGHSATPPPTTHSSYGSVPLSYTLNMNSICVQSTGSDVDGPAQVKVYLDMDVIDTSFVDVNTGMRHSYYRLNSNIVDDIREIVLHKRRARARPGLMKQKGNVFIFLAAPSNVG